jgi:hypothetical protein
VSGVDLPPWAKKKAAAPARGPRPTWVVVLAMAMMVFGGHLLTGGVSILRAIPEQSGAVEPPTGNPTLDDVRAVRASFALTHPTAVKLNALSKLALALLLLYAVAAVFSSDRRARTATMVAAWVGIGYHVGDALFLFFVVRKGMVAAAPMLASWAASQAGPGKATPSAGMLMSLTDGLIVGTSLVGVAFSVLLLAFFGGQRGQRFFNAGGPPRPLDPAHQPNHGA